MGIYEKDEPRLAHRSLPYIHRIRGGRLFGRSDGLAPVHQRGAFGALLRAVLDHAGRCLVSAAKKGSQTLIAVTLGDPNDWEDHQKMLDDAFCRSQTLRFSLKEVRIPVVGASAHSVGVSQKDICVRVPSSIAKKVKAQIYASHFLYAPVTAGQAVAKAVILYRSRELCSVTLTAAQNTQRQIINEGLLKRLFHYGKFRSQASKIYG